MPTRYFSLLLLLLLPLTARAQSQLPEVQPAMYIIADDGAESEEDGYSGSAPLNALFRARPDHLGDYNARYEWRFVRQGSETPFLVRYEEETRYTFAESGTYSVQLLATFVHGTDTLEYAADNPFVITISESRLEFPNAFTPNGDGTNDIFKAKDGYQSIVAFEATVYSRWGRKLFSWTDPAEGWDGRSGGKRMPDGGYYLVVKARGADGRHYDIKRVINLLTGYTEDTGGAQ